MSVIGEKLLIPFLITGEGGEEAPNIPAITPHFAFPFSRGANGKVRVVQQDSQAHIESCAQRIARCPLGARQERPEFGWRQPYMRVQPVDPSDLINALKRFEPRVGDAVPAEGAEQLAEMALGITSLDVDIKASLVDTTGAGEGGND